MNNLAIIPARGGSKRIPRKNIRNFQGKPIISYSINAARASGCFSEVMVSTDDNEIASISAEYGANVPFLRSSEASSDQSTTAAVISEVIGRYEARGLTFDSVCCIYPTAPLLTPARLIEGLRILEKGEDVGSVVPVLRFGHPIQRALQIIDGHLSMITPANLTLRSQDLTPSYHDAGQGYWIRTKAFLRSGSLINENSIAVILDESEAQDIDNISDWMLAEMKFKLREASACPP